MDLVKKTGPGTPLSSLKGHSQAECNQTEHEEPTGQTGQRLAEHSHRNTDRTPPPTSCRGIVTSTLYKRVGNLEGRELRTNDSPSAPLLVHLRARSHAVHSHEENFAWLHHPEKDLKTTHESFMQGFMYVWKIHQ